MAFTKETPVYRHSAQYAREHDELPKYRASYQANVACKDAINNAIRNNYGDNRLNSQSALDMIRADFSMERICYVLANTVRHKDWDGRISTDNKAWAKTIPVVENKDSWGIDSNCYFVADQPHPGLVNMFVTYFRKELAKEAPEKKPSVLDKLKAPLPEAKESHTPKMQEL